MSKNHSFYNLETIGGLLLFIATFIAMMIANSPLHHAYQTFLELPIRLHIGQFIINKPFHIWINDGLMALYFMLVGLEIKREIKRGILSSKASIIVPAITAFSGLLFPAAIFLFFNYHLPNFIHGWAIPTATDIAFTLGIVSLLGKKVPYSLKIMLTAIAIFDDIGAIAIIALFFTHDLSWWSLCLALCFTIILIGLNYFNCKRVSLYMVIGILLWAAVLKSGVHATLAGIIVAMTIPDNEANSLLNRIESGLHPWAVFLILPLFAFANAGVSFMGVDSHMLLSPLILGITFGLFFGKQVGIFIPLCFFVIQDKYFTAYKTYRITIAQVYGIALICGVGFTMSLFIGSLAFKGENTIMNLVKLGVVGGSLLSAITGILVFLFSKPGQRLADTMAD